MDSDNVSYLEVLVLGQDQSVVEDELTKLQVMVEPSEVSRDINVGIAILTISANGLVLVNELMKLKQNLVKRDSSIDVGIRGLDGKEHRLNQVDEETAKKIVSS